MGVPALGYFSRESNYVLPSLKLYLVALIHGNLFCLFCGDRHILAAPPLTSIATFVARRKRVLPCGLLKAQPGRKMIPTRKRGKLSFKYKI